jgi:tRNA-specific 2-thiouridylase
MNKKRVAVAMSGGVDSSVAAALLCEKNYDVVGITMDIFSLPGEVCRDESLRSCCGRGAIQKANQVAAVLGIPHYFLNLKKIFEKKVIEDFCGEYRQGRTPNPCIRCNEHIKFKALMGKAEKLGAEYLATGHHARIVHDLDSRRWLLKKGKDRQKDQSYFLYPLTQGQLSRSLLPIGDYTKEEVRKKAEDWDLPVAMRSESQEICFIPDQDYIRFLKERSPEAFRSGPIVDEEGNVLAHHSGIIHFTVGQRRGMGIAAPYPLYVKEIRANNNTIVVGTNDRLFKKKLVVSRPNWISVNALTLPLVAKVKIRYKHREAQAVLTPLDTNRVLVEFKEPQRAVTPGQAAVFYDKNIVIGGGMIEKPLDDDQ